MQPLVILKTTSDADAQYKGNSTIAFEIDGVEGNCVGNMRYDSWISGYVRINVTLGKGKANSSNSLGAKLIIKLS